MNQRPIMDAGPGINFFATNKERLLFDTMGPLSVPEVVEKEIRRKAGQDRRFAAAATVLNKIRPSLLEILSDDWTPDLAAVVRRLAKMSMEQRMQMSKDLGETMVIAHAVVAAERGASVRVLIDDRDGRQMATLEARRLERLREENPRTGRLLLVSTETVLRHAAGKKYLPDRASLRSLYARLRKLDDGLPPLEVTGLLDLAVWD